MLTLSIARPYPPDMFEILMPILAAASSAHSVCPALSSDFEKNERSYAFFYKVDADMLALREKWRDEDRAARHELELAKARLRGLGGFAPAGSGDSRADDEVRDAREKLQRTQDKYEREGDRITTLMVAHKCTPPDHLTSWTTYSD